MAISLSNDDSNRIVEILIESGEWLTVQRRVDFVLDVFAGSQRQSSILGLLDLDGNPRSVAVRVITSLAQFGQDEPGRESLGVLINKLLAYLGGGEKAEFLRGLLGKYPFTTSPTAVRPIAGWRGRESASGVLEKIIGENTLRDIAMLEVLLQMSRAVVRVKTPFQTGTGFLIAEDLIITNHHVIESQKTAEKSTFQFNYQLGPSGKELNVQSVGALADGLFQTSPVEDDGVNRSALDYSVVQISEAPKGISPLRLRRGAVKRDDRVTIIQHPGGSYKKISLQNNFIQFADESVVQYTTSTEPGSSGAPVISDEFEVVALHHAGGELIEPGTKRRYLRNEGIRSSAILDDLSDKGSKILGLSAGIGENIQISMIQ
jgi:V8-like Glu-specific endopeptidase